ncbi:MAG: hypothetical protein ACOVP1_10275 [Bacteroidia bacterium]
MNKLIKLLLKKRSYHLATSLFLFLLMHSCGKPNKEFVLKVKINQLKADQIFDSDLVMDMVFDANEFSQDSIQRHARELFLRGLDEIKNKKNPLKAIQLFKESLTYFPEAKTYFELGNALLLFKNNQDLLEQAQICFFIADELMFKPQYMNHLKKAKVAAMLIHLEKEVPINDYSWYEVKNELKQSYKTGYIDTISLKKDPAFADFLRTFAYQQLIIELQTENQETNQLSKFDVFKNSFTHFNPELQIGVKEVGMDHFRQSISYDFAEFIPEMENVSFGREVSNDFYYVAKVAETEDYVALVYCTSSFSGEGYQPVETILAVYNQQGKQLSRKLISCRCSAERVKTCSFKNGEFEMEEHRLIWDKPLNEISIDENKIKSTDLIGKAVFKLQNNGSISGENTPSIFNDSSRIAKK